MHTFPSREALTPEWGERMAQARGHSGQGLLFTDESVVYSPGQFVSNITAAMDPPSTPPRRSASCLEAMTWVTVVVHDRLAREVPEAEGGGAGVERLVAPAGAVALLELLDLFAFQRDNRLIRDPVDVFNERCFIGFESDETLVYRLWDVFQDVAIWSSDYPHHDAEDAWDGLHHMTEFKVPSRRSAMLGENARTLYGIEPLMTVEERIQDYAPAILPW